MASDLWYGGIYLLKLEISKPIIKYFSTVVTPVCYVLHSKNCNNPGKIAKKYCTKKISHFVSCEVSRFKKLVANFPIALIMTELSKYMQFFYIFENKIKQILFIMSTNYDLINETIYTSRL
mgnify:CR=1 FL=1